MKPDLSPMISWENGLESIPELMNLNLQALREGKAPSLCLYQWDETHPMNPLGPRGGQGTLRSGVGRTLPRTAESAKPLRG